MTIFPIISFPYPKSYRVDKSPQPPFAKGGQGGFSWSVGDAPAMNRRITVRKWQILYLR